MVEITRGSMSAKNQSRADQPARRRVSRFVLSAGGLVVLALLGTDHGFARASGGSSDGPGGDRQAASAVTSVITLPYVANAFTDPHNPRSSVDVYNSKFTVTDTGTAVACVTVAYSFIGGSRSPVLDDGPAGNLCAHGYPVAPGSKLTFAPEAGRDAVAMPASTSNALMQATVAATGAPVTVDVDAYVTNSAVKTHASYAGLVASSSDASAVELGTRVTVDNVQKTADGYFSQIFVANAGAAVAQVSIRYSSMDGTAYSMSLPVPAASGARYGLYDDDLLPVGFKGSAVLTSDQPIGTVVFQAKMTGPGTFAYDDVYSAAPGSAERVSPPIEPPVQTVHDTGAFAVSRTVVIYAVALLGVIGLVGGFGVRRARLVLLSGKHREAHDLSSMPGMAPARTPHLQVEPEPAPSAPRTRRPWGRLVVVEGQDAGQSFVLSEDTELVGRGRFCSVRLKDKEVAAAHFLVNREGWVQPSTPACAIEVDGAKARSRSLANGSLIRVGRTCLRFEIT